MQTSVSIDELMLFKRAMLDPTVPHPRRLPACVVRVLTLYSTHYSTRISQYERSLLFQKISQDRMNRMFHVKHKGGGVQISS